MQTDTTCRQHPWLHPWRVHTATVPLCTHTRYPNKPAILTFLKLLLFRILDFDSHVRHKLPDNSHSVSVCQILFTNEELHSIFRTLLTLMFVHEMFLRIPNKFLTLSNVEVILNFWSKIDIDTRTQNKNPAFCLLFYMINLVCSCPLLGWDR